MVEWVTYDVYGKAVVRNSAGTTQGSSYVGNPYLFTGREFDTESGMYHYRARAYDPEAGRFLQRDPLGYVDGLSLYEYCRSRPWCGIDPFGMGFFNWLGERLSDLADIADAGIKVAATAVVPGGGARVGINIAHGTPPLAGTGFGEGEIGNAVGDALGKKIGEVVAPGIAKVADKTGLSQKAVSGWAQAILAVVGVKLKSKFDKWLDERRTRRASGDPLPEPDDPTPSTAVSTPSGTSPSPTQAPGNRRVRGPKNHGPVPRPRGIPSHWPSRPSRGGGSIWTNPRRADDWVRTDPGRPSSPYPNSRGPYVRRHKNGCYLDKDGNPIPNGKRAEDTHIPFDDFRFFP